MELSLTKVIVIIAILGTVAYLGHQIKTKYSDESVICEYRLVKQYILNDSQIYSHNKPKLWIHSEYEINARKWRDFGSRNTTDLNQPYIHLTIQSVIQHCSQDFHILLIDDDSFGKLLDDWDVDLSTMAGHQKECWRQYGLAKLLWTYGGCILPNSFVCLKSVLPLYKEHIGKPFVVEVPNKTSGVHLQQKFIPSMLLIGCSEPRCPGIEAFMEFLQKRASLHSSVEDDIDGMVASWLSIANCRGLFDVISGECIAVKKYRKNKAICLEDWMEEKDIELSSNCYGIYIPSKEILTRPKYQWFASLHTYDILKSNMILSKYLRMALPQEEKGEDSSSCQKNQYSL